MDLPFSALTLGINWLLVNHPPMKRFLIVLAKVLAALVLLLILAATLFLGWLKWSGDREWKRAEAELRAKGEKLTFAELVPPMPPEKENFFADPIWQELADLVPVTKKSDGVEYVELEPRVPTEKLLINQWKTPLSPAEQEEIKALIPKATSSKSNWQERLPAIKSLNWELDQTTDPQKRKQIANLELQLMQPAEPFLAKITELSKRPSASYPVRWQDGAGAPLPQLTAILSLGQLLKAKCIAELKLGETDAAFTDTHTLIRLSTVQSNEPVLISHLIRLSMTAISIDAIDKGLECHAWSNGALIEFQQDLTAIHLGNDLLFALRGERALFNVSIASKSFGKSICMSAPVAFLYQQLFKYGQGYYNDLIQRCVETLQQSFPQGVNASTPLFKQELKSLQSHPIKKSLHFIETLSLPVLDSTIQKTIEAQTEVEQSLIACALERYRLSHGSYPNSLDSLVPEYLVSVPKEPTTGKPMNYRLLNDASFLLWSPGWKLQTLGGKPGEFVGEGDIVWNQSLPRKSRAVAAPKS